MSRKQPSNLSRNAKRARRGLAWTGVICTLLLAPLLWVHLSLYWSNLAMAGGTWPQAPALGPNDRILVVSPHPDDEVLGAGGLLARARAMKLPVRLVFLTNGDGSQSTQLYENLRQPRRYPNRPDTYIKLALMRQREALSAAAKLGIPGEDVTFLGYPDGGMRTLWTTNWSPANPYRSVYTARDHSPYANSRTPDTAYCGQSALADVEGEISDFRPTIVLTTHPADTHPDHHTAYDLSAATLEEIRGEEPEADWARKTRLLAFLVHHGPWPAPAGYRPDLPLVPPSALKEGDTSWLTVPLRDRERDDKKAALECYTSQLATTPRYLRSFVRRNELFGVVSAHTVAPRGEAVTILQDPTRDALLRDLWPAADVRDVSLQSGAGGSLTARLKLQGRPSARIGYELTLHELSPSAAPRVWRVRVRSSTRGWTAEARRTDGTLRDLSAQASGNSLSFALPFQAPREGSALLFATTRLGNTSLDQTETATVRWQ